MSVRFSIHAFITAVLFWLGWTAYPQTAAAFYTAAIFMALLTLNVIVRDAVLVLHNLQDLKEGP